MKEDDRCSSTKLIGGDSSTARFKAELSSPQMQLQTARFAEVRVKAWQRWGDYLITSNELEQ